LGILGFALYSSRKGSDLSSDDDDEIADRADVLNEIAALDDEFEANNIDEDEYNERRDELKRLAMELGDDTSSLAPESEAESDADDDEQSSVDGDAEESEK
jgi:hypothetical protein